LLAVMACQDTQPTHPLARAPRSPNRTVIPASNSYGLNMGGFAGNSAESVAGYMNQGNIGWVRSGIAWYNVEALWIWRGHDCHTDVNESRDASIWQWGPSDEAYTRAVNNGLNLEFILGGTPCNESTMADSGEEIAIRANPDTVGWALFVQRVVNRYPNVKAWGILNEVNDIGQYKGAPGLSRTEAYAQLIRVAAPIIHAAGGSVVALELGDVSSDGIPREDWVSQVFQLVGDNIDILGLHEYNLNVAWVNSASAAAAAAAPNSPGAYNIWMTEAGYPAELPNESELETNLSSYLTALQGGGAPAWKKLFYWNGYTTAADNDSRNVFNSDGVNPVTPKVAYHTYKCGTQGLPLGGCALFINGPTSVRPNALCEWWVTADYSVSNPYQWRINGNPVGPNDAFADLQAPSSDFDLTVSVGPAGTVTRRITVSSSASICPH
jgi:hypothetical protein